MPTSIYTNKKLMATPTEREHLVNKGYVDDAIGRKIKDAVMVVTCNDVNSTYDSTEKTLTQNIGGSYEIDDVVLVVGDRILIAGQTDATQNGIYIVKELGVAGTPSSATVSLGGSNTGVVTIDTTTCTTGTFETKITTTGAYTFAYSDTDASWMLDGTAIELVDYGIIAAETPADGDTIIVSYIEPGIGTPGVLKRAEDFDTTEDLGLNFIVPVQRGTQNSDTNWQISNDVVPRLDTDVITFVKFKGAGGIAKFTTTFTGDGTLKEWTITHGLGTEDVMIRITDFITGEKAIFKVVPTTENTITITSDVVLKATEKFNVLVMG